MNRKFRLHILHRYVLVQFLNLFALCLIASVSLFMVFDLFERLKFFLRDDSTFLQAFQYMLFKIPLILQIMTPISVLVATLMSIGRLSQLSETTAMRACGASLFWLARPLLFAGLAVSLLMFISGETLVPWATRRGEEIYNVEIRKKLERGKYSRENFWHRSKNRFYNIGFYDSRDSTLNDFVLVEFNDAFELTRRLDSKRVVWQKPLIGWTMEDVTEITFGVDRRMQTATYNRLPLVIPEKPRDFYEVKILPESMSYLQLLRHSKKLAGEGAPITEYLVALASKISFPLVNVVVVLIAFPFALIPARSGTLTPSFVAGVSIGFGYHVVHAVSTSLGSAELIPILASAWAANIIFGLIGGYLMAGAEYA